MRPVFPEASSGMIVSALASTELLEEVKGVVDYFFPRDVESYMEMAPDDYRSLVAQAQSDLNRRQLGRRLAKDRRDIICEVLDTKNPMIQSNLYLRATRPSNSSVRENVGWHRESFYGPNMQESINFWVPVANVSSENAIRYVADSHLIPDSEIETVSEADPSVARFSAGHKIGLPYAPKKIVSGVDLDVHHPFVVLPGEAAIFAGALIHGAAENHSDRIRFSVDFRLLAAESLTETKEHFASGKSYFEPL